jgi:hypothetical protein
VSKNELSIRETREISNYLAAGYDEHAPFCRTTDPTSCVGNVCVLGTMYGVVPASVAPPV